jgi:hypothetical protein
MNTFKRQKGDFLIEAMVGTMITALVSLGMLAISSRVMLTQEEMGRQEAIVTSLRERLQSHNPNDAATDQCKLAEAKRSLTLPDKTALTYVVNCPSRTVDYKIGGKTYTVNLPMADMTVTNSATKATYTLGAG